MSKLVIFACLLVVCLAQQPPRPKLPETFTSTSSVFRKIGREELRGSGKWDRSETAKSFVEISEYTGRDNTKEFFEHLGLFQVHKEYNLMTGDNGQKRCEPHDIPTDAQFPMIWDWLQTAEYHKFEDHRSNKTYDAWSAHTRDGRDVTLIVTEDNPDMPVALMTRNHEVFHDMRFMSFSATEPMASVFTVPPECMSPPRHH